MSTPGVSRKVHILGPSSGKRRASRKTAGLKLMSTEQKRVREEYQNLLRGMNARSRRILADLRRDPDAIPEDRSDEVVTIIEGDREGSGWVDEPTYLETGAAHTVSNEESVEIALRDLLDSRLGYRKYKDTRTWRQRIDNMDARWQDLMPKLLVAYVQWKYRPQDEVPTQAEPTDYDFNIECIDYLDRQEVLHVPRTSQHSAAEALILNGFLGATPDQPTLAVSLKTLELLEDIRRFKPSFSIEAFTKMLCYRYVIPYRRRYRKAISDTFDVYLTLIDRVRDSVQTILGRGSANWRVRYGCPACSYKVEGEEQPIYQRMIVMDGNNSLKRVAPFGNRKVGDARSFVSDYYIPSSIVENFANEVKSRQKQPHVQVPENDGSGDEDGPGGEGDPTDGAPDSSCASNWKAAASDEKKRMWAIFEETGVFAAACRHGFVLWLIDMIRSGELAKLPLAMTDQIIKEIGDAVLLGFDIGCTYKVTLRNSSLGPAFEALGGRVCVNAFHGYSHSYPCQLQNHPNAIAGMGLEDLETLERVFSASNQLANVTRYASAYRRKLLIHTYFRGWDEEKYANLGLMQYNNYLQAQEIIRTKKPAFDEAMTALQLTHEELSALEKEESEYFANLRDESPWDVHAVAYVDALDEWRGARAQLGDAEDRFLGAVPKDYEWRAPTSGPTDYYSEASATVKLETRRRALQADVQRLELQIIALEVKLKIPGRWKPGDREYEETKKYIASRNYQQALGRLQRLVIQRLFELHKLNLSQTAYRMRTQIAKNLQKRCKAIRTAVSQYNSAAAALTPPRPALDWDKVSHFSVLEEFTLLQDTRNDIRDKKWAQPLVKETMRTGRRIIRAEEELKHVEREARRIHTSIRDEDVLFTDVLGDLVAHNVPMFGAVQDYCQRRRAVNTHILAHLLRLYALEGYSGIPSPGVHAGPPREVRTPREVDHSSVGHQSSLPSSDEHITESSPDSPMNTDADQPGVRVTASPRMDMEMMATAEVRAVEKDAAEEAVGVDEDDDGAVTDLVEHLSNIAVVM